MKLKADLLVVSTVILDLAACVYLYYLTGIKYDIDPYLALTIITIAGVSLFIFLWGKFSSATCPGCNHRFALGWGTAYVDLHKVPDSCPHCGFSFV